MLSWKVFKYFGVESSSITGGRGGVEMRGASAPGPDLKRIQYGPLLIGAGHVQPSSASEGAMPGGMVPFLAVFHRVVEGKTSLSFPSLSPHLLQWSATAD